MSDGVTRIVPSTERTVAFLSRPESYPECPAQVYVLETHFSWVFLIDTRAYKLKKPVQGDGFDFRSAEARGGNAVIEVRLNRRLAPDTYLGAVPVVQAADGGLALRGIGRPIDWLVEMVRLDADRSLDRLLARHEVSHGEIEALAATLAGFFATAAVTRVAPARLNARMMREIQKTVVAFRAAGHAALQEAVMVCGRRLKWFLVHRSALLRNRRIVDGHGDLRPEHIYLNGTARIIDCLEFRADLRQLDPLSEIAYLGLECDRLGGRGVKRHLLRRYSERTGDRPPPGLIHFYRALNALVRARIAVEHLSEPGSQMAGKWIDRAYEYVTLAVKECCLLTAACEEHLPH